MNPIVVKIGGSTLGSHDTTLADLVALQRAGALVVVVHGGGKAISDWQSRLGLETRFVDGRRVTDEASLTIAVAVLAGIVNKELVAAVGALGGRAVGLAGADGGLLECVQRDPRLGLVGEVQRVNTAVLADLLAGGYQPFVAPIGIGPNGQLLNVNGDTAAGEIAAAVGADRLVFLTDVPGVLDGDGKLIAALDRPSALALLKSGVAGGGMIPKLEACLRATAAGGIAEIVDGRQAGALLRALQGEGGGTKIQ
ncbi:MAG: acetylglutamate kinase [Chloroflexi bacterium]|nr:acetylglutamate kinase [Chloroflexota bacterium]